MKVNIIHPYKIGNTWFFDDSETGLVREPFVQGTSEFVDKIIECFGLDPRYISVLFSDKDFWRATSSVIKIDKIEEEDGGCWYMSRAFGHKFWLCPQIFRYFDSPPEQIYIKLV